MLYKYFMWFHVPKGYGVNHISGVHTINLYSCYISLNFDIGIEFLILNYSLNNCIFLR